MEIFSDDKDCSEEDASEEDNQLHWKDNVLILKHCFLSYVKVVNHSCATYYYKINVRLEIKGRIRYQNLSEEEKEKKSNSMVVNDIKTFHRLIEYK